MAKSYFAISLHIRLADLQGIKAYTTVDHLSGGQIATAVVGIPPLAEQHRIVAKVDELLALCDRLESEQNDSATAHVQLVETLLGTLTQSTDANDFEANWNRIAEHFDTLFTTEASIDALQNTVLKLAVSGKLVRQIANEPSAESSISSIREETRIAFKNGAIKRIPKESLPDSTVLTNLPGGWHWATLLEVIQPVPNAIKRGPFGSAIRKDMFVPSGYKVYEQQHAIYGDFSVGSHYLNEAKFSELSAFELFPGEILISCSGTVGKVSIVPEGIERGVINQALLKIRLHKSAISNEYFAILFPAYFLELDSLTELQGTAQKNMPGMDVIKSLKFPLPPLPEQQRIIAKVDELMAVCDSLKKQLAESRNQEGRLADTIIQASLKAA